LDYFHIKINGVGKYPLYKLISAAVTKLYDLNKTD